MAGTPGVVIPGYRALQRRYERPIVMIGNFDGLHLGHRQLIKQVTGRAQAEHGTSFVYTFRPHPNLALVNDPELQLINTYDEKLALIQAAGIDVIVEEPFDRKFAELSPEQFINEVLIERIGAAAVYVGFNFGFGRQRRGNLELLGALCERNQIDLRVISALQIDGEICSSTNIRGCLRRGDVKMANRFLGREFFYRGTVIRGDGRGRKLGFATANLSLELKLLIKGGVYATRTVWKGQVFQSVTNIGARPTFGSDGLAAPIVETHIFGIDRELYGEKIEIRFVDRIRDEVRFSGVDTLTAQIRSDCARARQILTPR